MARFCKNCGKELEEGSIFCNECGTKFGESKPSSNYSKTSTNQSFKKYSISMIDGEEVIRSSQIHVGCLYLPLIIINDWSYDNNSFNILWRFWTYCNF